MREQAYQFAALCDAKRLGKRMTQALFMYRRARFVGWIKRRWSALIGRPVQLQRLSDVLVENAVQSGHYAGLQAVPISWIRGSEGRTNDFDAAFYPLGKHTRRRWLPIALARLRGCPLPPVALIQVGANYFVRDGHHRISVARALGEEYIDAEVMSWEVGVLIR